MRCNQHCAETSRKDAIRTSRGRRECWNGNEAWQRENGFPGGDRGIFTTYTSHEESSEFGFVSTVRANDSHSQELKSDLGQQNETMRLQHAAGSPIEDLLTDGNTQLINSVKILIIGSGLVGTLPYKREEVEKEEEGTTRRRMGMAPPRLSK